MEIGHWDQERKGLQSTKNLPTKINVDEDDFPIKTTTKMYERFATIVPSITYPTKVYIGVKGRFPHISSKGNKYLLFFTIWAGERRNI